MFHKPNSYAYSDPKRATTKLENTRTPLQIQRKDQHSLAAYAYNDNTTDSDKRPAEAKVLRKRPIAQKTKNWSATILPDAHRTNSDKTTNIC